MDEEVELDAFVLLPNEDLGERGKSSTYRRK